MFGGVNSIDSMFSGSSSDSLFNPLAGLGPASFGSVFNQAMSQATTPQQKAEVLFAQAKFSNEMAMANMFSDPNSPGSMMDLAGLFGAGGPASLPSWVYDAERLLGGNPTVQGAANMVQQANFLAQTRFNSSLAGLGLGGSVNSFM